MVARIPQNLADLRAENRLLRTPEVPPVVRTPRQSAFTATKVPRFGGTTNTNRFLTLYSAFEWMETTALQLFSHLEGDKLNVALLVPMSRRLSRTGLVDTLSAHYGSPGRLADYRRQFERMTRMAGEDPSIFATALETLAVKAFGDMGQTARLRLIRDCFIAGHSSCELRRYLDSVPPETPIQAFGDKGQTARLRLIRDRFIAGHSSCELRRYLDSVPPETPMRGVVDRCRIWGSHADLEVRPISKPSPDPIYPGYVIGDLDNISEMTRVAAVTRPKSGPDQLDDMHRRLLAAVATPAPVPAPVPEVPAVDKLLQHLVAETQSRPLPVVSPPEPVGLEKLFRSYLLGQQPVRPPTRQRPIRRDWKWNGVVCFSCGKSGHAATRCPALDELFPFMLPGWRAESTQGGYVMISPRCRRSVVAWKTATDLGGGVRHPDQ